MKRRNLSLQSIEPTPKPGLWWISALRLLISSGIVTVLAAVEAVDNWIWGGFTAVCVNMTYAKYASRCELELGF